MENIEAGVALVIGLAVVMFVPLLVWLTVIGGLIQIVREKVRENRSVKIEPGPEARQPTRSH